MLAVSSIPAEFFSFALEGCLSASASPAAVLLLTPTPGDLLRPLSSLLLEREARRARGGLLLTALELRFLLLLLSSLLSSSPRLLLLLSSLLSSSLRFLLLLLSSPPPRLLGLRLLLALLSFCFKSLSASRSCLLLLPPVSASRRLLRLRLRWLRLLLALSSLLPLWSRLGLQCNSRGHKCML
jgi:hypothetical protein